MKKTRKLVLIGDSAFAEVAYEYFTDDSDYELAAFCVEAAWRKRSTLFGKPIVDFETLESVYPPQECDFFAALVYTQLNRLRARLYGEAKAKGYRPASFISKHARIARSATLGEHCFIFENNVIQPFVRLGNNVVLWSGNHIGHHSRIGDHCFVSSHVVVSGFVEIGAYSFLGVNSAIANNICIAEDNWIGPGVTISQDTQKDMLFPPSKTEASRVSAHRFFRVKD